MAGSGIRLTPLRPKIPSSATPIRFGLSFIHAGRKDGVALSCGDFSRLPCKTYSHQGGSNKVDSLTGNVKMSRRRALRDLLTRAQVAHGERLVGLYAICSDDRVSSPGDEMDVASEHAEAETHARLIEHRWSSQAVLDDALERLRRGLYGICEECGEEISLERLSVIPFTAYCIDCQHQRENKKATVLEHTES
jgi:DnaK suppressor protein